MTAARLALIVFGCLCSASAAPPPTPDGPLQALEASSLFALQESADASIVWAQYERFLLSKSRSTPLLLYFSSSSACLNEIHDDEAEDEESESIEVSSVDQEACMRHQKLVDAAVELAAETLSSPQLPVVRVDTRQWPEMRHYHLISKTPSLLWLPGRASGRFQRYPHVETNFLDLRANESLFTGKLSDADFNQEQESIQQNEVAKEVVAGEIAAFVRLCQERSGYLIRNARGRLTPTVPVSYGVGDEGFSDSELIPILTFVASIAFIALVVNENREFVLGLVQTRLFWFALCLGVIYIALSGLFHSIIHRRAWYYFGRLHGFVFVYPSSRRQFVLEGLVNGTWSFWLSLGVMSITDVTPALRSRLAREELIRWSLLLVVVSYLALYLTFLMKYRWLA